MIRPKIILQYVLLFSFLPVFNRCCPSEKPEILVNPSEMTFIALESGANPSSQRLYVKNAGKGVLDYSVTDNAEWLNVNPRGGSSAGDTVEHEVSVNIQSLLGGTYMGTLVIADNNAANNPQYVKAKLEVFHRDKILISCNPDSGKTGAIITVPISIKGNTKEIKAFGLELTFDRAMFEYQGTSKGDLTGSWPTVDGNEIRAGTVRVGGYAGGSDSTIPVIPTCSKGSIAKITLKVVYSGAIDGLQSQISIQNYVDGIAAMTPHPNYATFTYRK
jgi:hypothetical protein